MKWVPWISLKSLKSEVTESPFSNRKTILLELPPLYYVELLRIILMIWNGRLMMVLVLLKLLPKIPDLFQVLGLPRWNYLNGFSRMEKRHRDCCNILSRNLQRPLKLFHGLWPRLRDLMLQRY